MQGISVSELLMRPGCARFCSNLQVLFKEFLLPLWLELCERHSGVVHDHALLYRKEGVGCLKEQPVKDWTIAENRELPDGGSLRGEDSIPPSSGDRPAPRC